jgi:hypothetical protein
MTTTELENRLAAIEQELTLLKARISIPPASRNHWIEKIAGTFSSPDARTAFDEAMRYGRQWRAAQRPKPRKRRRITKK